MEPPTPDMIARYDNIFAQLKDQPTALSGGCAKERWAAFGLPGDVLLRIWSLADGTKRGALEVQEHRVAMHLIQHARTGGQIPDTVPPAVLAAVSQTGTGGGGPPIPAATPPQAAAPAPTPPAATLDASSPWNLSSDDVKLYRQMFDSADAAKAGKVSAAGSQLNRSGLPTSP